MSSKVLFACSKYFSRHPYEELSSGQQLCKVNQIIRIKFLKQTQNATNKQHFACVCMHCAKSKGCVRGLLFLAITK